MRLPLLISVPHGGLDVPPELRPFLRIGPDLIEAGSDVGSFEVYSSLGEDRVLAYRAQRWARVLVDVNRGADNRKPDGVIKTFVQGHMVYDPYPDPAVIETVIERYHAPYHRDLERLARLPGVKLGVDCHTMFASAPPDAPDPQGSSRPMICLSDGGGTSLPSGWMDGLARHLRQQFGPTQVKVNEPFNGGHIVRRHSARLPFVQIEISRSEALGWQEKGERVHAALAGFCQEQFGTAPISRRCRLFEWVRRLWRCCA